LAETKRFSPLDDAWYLIAMYHVENTGWMSKKEGLATSYCLQATLLMILKASELENLRVKLVTRLKSDSALESYQQCPTL